METFLRSNNAVRLMLFADLLAVVGWSIVRATGGGEGEFPLFELFGLGGWNALFFWGRARLNANRGSQPSSPSA